MYARALANSPEAMAQAEARERWGGPPHTVCKRKYRPFNADGQRLYGCHFHSPIREARILKAGEREGWVSFARLHNQGKAAQEARAVGANADG